MIISVSFSMLTSVFITMSFFRFVMLLGLNSCQFLVLFVSNLRFIPNIWFCTHFFKNLIRSIIFR